jgi:predicted nucleic acid-binding protein
MIIKSTWKKNMGGEVRVLFDLNILLDVLQERQPFYQASASLLAYAETGRIKGWIAAHSVTTLYYLIAKDKSADQARVIITRLLQFLRIAAVDQSTIEQSLNLPYRDFEDAIQVMAAVQIKAAYLVSRNIKDFQPSPLPVLQPADLLAIL